MAVVFHRTAVPDLEVRSFSLQEEMNRPFRARVEVVSRDPALDFHDVLGEAATLELGPDAVVPGVRGIVRRIRQLASGAPATGEAGASLTLYEIEIMPELALLDERTDHRIFQDLDVVAILAEVLASYGGLVAVPDAQLVEVRPPREYTTQYGETDLAFVSRLLEENGIAFFFDHFASSRWILCDTPARYVRPLDGPIPYLEVTEPAGAGLHLFKGKLEESIRAGRATLRAHDAEKPELPLFASQAGAGGALHRLEPALERYGYAAGAFTAATAARGQARARIALAAHRAQRRAMKLRSTFAFPPGATLTIADHPGAGVDGEWLVVASSTGSDAKGSKHKLRLVQADPMEPYRPPHRTPRPRIAGCQTATVWGPPGEEIPVDSRGRVRVRFHWDRSKDDAARAPTRFLRVSQAWAGQGLGGMFLPRTGQEVIVEYLDGDPDEPIVTGRVHNEIQVPPLLLPAQRTRSVLRTLSSPGGNGYNEILFEDAAGAERLDVHAQRDSSWVTERNAKRFVGVDDVVTVGGSQQQTIGGSQQQTIAGSQELTVGGSQQQTIAGSQSTTVGGTQTVDAGEDIYLGARVRVQLTGGYNIDERARWIDVQGGVKYRVGAPIVEINGHKTRISSHEIFVDAQSMSMGLSGLLSVHSPYIALLTGAARIQMKGTILIEAPEVIIKAGTIKLNP